MRGIPAVLLGGAFGLACPATAQYGGGGDPTAEVTRANAEITKTVSRNEIGNGQDKSGPSCNGLSGVKRLSCFREQKQLAAAAAATGTTGAAQDANSASAKTATPKDPRARCSTLSGAERNRCLSDANAAEKRATGGGGVSAKDAKLINDTRTAAQVKIDAGDFTGAAAIYQQAIDTAGPKSPVLYRLMVGIAIAQRRQGVAAYNGGTQPTYPPAGATNDQIRAANAANAALQAQKSAAAVPLLKQALASAAQAAALAEAGKDRSADEFIGVEMREDAGLLYRIDHDAVLATPRASIDTEVTWFNRWFDATNPLAETLAAKYGFAVAAGLTAKDKTAGLALADKVRARTGNDVDGLLGYADIVVAAKAPAGDPRRVKALADLTAAEPTVADSLQNQKLKRLKAALAATS